MPMVDYFNPPNGQPVQGRSCRLSFVVPTDGTSPPYVPTLIMVDADGTITGWLADDDQSAGNSARTWTVKAGICYPLSLVKVTSKTTLTLITGMI